MERDESDFKLGWRLGYYTAATDILQYLCNNTHLLAGGWYDAWISFGGQDNDGEIFPEGWLKMLSGEE